MIIVDDHCQEHFDRVVAEAGKIGLADKLWRALEYLSTYACQDDPERTRCRLFYDFAPLSFSFAMEILNDAGEYVSWFGGGLIYQGPDVPADGSFPSLTVSLGDPTRVGWFMHT